MPTASDARGAAAVPAKVDDQTSGAAFFFGMPMPLVCVLLVLMFVAPAIGDSSTTGGRLFGFAVGGGAALALFGRFTDRVHRRYLGGTFALLAAIFAIGGFLRAVLQFYAESPPQSWAAAAATGA